MSTTHEDEHIEGSVICLVNAMFETSKEYRNINDTC